MSLFENVRKLLYPILKEALQGGSFGLVRDDDMEMNETWNMETYRMGGVC